jgi:hypothetical protein
MACLDAHLYEIEYMIIHRTIDVSIVQWPAIKTSHHFSVTKKSKCV